MSASASFVIDAAIRDYHVYKEIWPSPIDEERLTCEREVGNLHDPLSVAVKKAIDGRTQLLDTSLDVYLLYVQFLLEEAGPSRLLQMVRGDVQLTYPKVGWNCPANYFSVLLVLQDEKIGPICYGKELLRAKRSNNDHECYCYH